MSEENVDVRKTFASYMGIVFRAIAYWKWGVLVCLIVTMAGTAYAATRKKIWDSRTRIRVVSTRVTNGFDPMEDQIQEELKNRLKAYISADRYLQEVVDEFGLYREEKLQRNWTDLEVLNYMRGKINWGVYKGDEFSITFYDHDPRIAQAVTQKLAENFMNQERGSDVNLFRTKLERVTTQLDQLLVKRDQLFEKETHFRRVNADLIKALEQRRMGGATSIDSGEDIVIGSDDTKFTRYDSPKLRSLRRRLRDLEETSANIRAKQNQPSSRDQALGQQRAQAAAEVQKAKQWYDRLRAQYTDQHPDLQNAKASLARAEARQREVDARFREAQRDAREPSAQLLQVNQEIKQVRDEVRRLAAIERRKAASRPEETVPEREPDSGVDSKVASASRLGVQKLKTVEEVDAALKRMKTQIEPITQQIQELDAKRLKLQFETEQREQGGARQYQVIDPPRIPSKPSGPHRTKIALMSAFGGFAIGCGLMLMLGFLDSRIYRPSDMGRLEHVQLLATVPDFENEIREIVAQSSAAVDEVNGHPEERPPM